MSFFSDAAKSLKSQRVWFSALILVLGVACYGELETQDQALAQLAPEIERLLETGGAADRVAARGSTHAWQQPEYLEEPSGKWVPTRDMRDWAIERTAANRVLYADRLALDNRFFARATVNRAKRHGIDIQADPELALLASESQIGILSLDDPALDDAPVPGGVGYGVSYDNSEMHWTSSTCLYHDIIVPKTPGGDVITWLYNTATNRSEKGVEAFISYYAQNDMMFRIYDWSKATHDERWVFDIGYNDAAEYLANVESGDEAYRQEIRVCNCTAGVETSWANNVWLYNFITDTYDWVYGTTYVLTSADENLYSPGDAGGWWGPICETFQDHDGSNKAIGTGDSWIFQDNSSWHRLDASNSSIRIDDPDLSPPIFLVNHAEWAVGSVTGEFVPSMAEAEDLDHPIGRSTPGGWVAEPADGADWMVWGWTPFGATPAAGDYVVQFDLAVAALGSGATAFVGLYDRNGASYVAATWVNLADFHAAGNTQPFRLEFTTTGSEALATGVYYTGTGTLIADRISVVEN
jgi:hypothetical protein